METRHLNQFSRKRWYDREAKKDLVLSIVNEIRLPFLKVAARARYTVSAYRRHYTNVVHVDSTNDYRMWSIEFDLPATRKPVVYGLYVSAQEWYISPKEARRRAKRFWRWIKKRVPPDADMYTAFIGKRATSKAKAVLASEGLPFRSPRDVKKDILKYFEKRTNALKAALRGKRIFGELAILAWILVAIQMELAGHDTTKLYEMSDYVLRVAMEDLPGGLPPPGDEFIDTLIKAVASVQTIHTHNM